MKLFNVKQIAEIDGYTIRNEPVRSSDLMERAAKTIFKWIINNTSFGSFTVFAGYGNNGGDGLVVARLLIKKGYSVNVYILENDRYSADFSLNLKRLKGICKIEIFDKKTKPAFNECVIDALFGSGLSRPLEGNAEKAVKLINSSGKPVISVDIPSGLMGDGNSDIKENTVVKAAFTVSLQFPKISFFFSENNIYTGDWHVVPIGLHRDAIKKTKTEYHFTDIDDIRTFIKMRNKFAHKGSYGHALIFTGSDGKFGAGVLAAKACVHSGAGLSTVFTSPEGINVFQTAVPEAMGIFSNVLPDLKPFTAIAAGPGLGTVKNKVTILAQLLKNSKVPLVLDADALNMIANDKKLLKLIPSGTIITPHPREFTRLAGETANSYEMLNKAVKFAKDHKIVVVLKGAYTRVINPDGKIFFNSTGNPGMAKGGSGDVLTGIIVSLLARGYSPEEAAKLGVFIHGMAGDMAADDLSQEYISAGDIISYLCHAFKNIYLL